MSIESKYINSDYKNFFEKNLSESDPEIFKAINNELIRQQNHIELIASENIVSKAVLDAQGSIMTNKYAEGYPSKRYYGGCEFVDVAESLESDSELDIVLDKLKESDQGQYSGLDQTQYVYDFQYSSTDLRSRHTLEY